MNKLIVIALLVLGFGFLTYRVVSATDSVKICHSTGSQNNPYITHNPNIQNNGDLSGGHLNHSGDIIPPYERSGPDYPGKNWTANGQAIWNNDCNSVQASPSPSASPSTSPTPSPSATPVVTPSPSPTIQPECDGECWTPSPTPTPTPTETPVVNCGDTGYPDASGTKCLEWAKPESPEFFRNQQPLFPGEGPIVGPMK